MRNCERCHEPISSTRLVALPETELCIDCAKLKAVLPPKVDAEWFKLDWSRFGEAKDGEVKAQPAERNAQERAEHTPYRIAEGLEEYSE